MSTRLAAWLIGERMLPEATVRAAVARQLVYGGSLDTALLEMKALGEAAVWERLAAATGLPVPAPELFEWLGAGGREAGGPPDSAAAAAIPAEASGRLGAVPVARDGEHVDVLCSEPVAEDEIREAAAAAGLDARLFVVPEVRLVAARERVYGEPIPARYAPLITWRARAARDRSDGAIAAAPAARTVEEEGIVDMIAEADESAGADLMSELTARGPSPIAAEGTPLARVLDLAGPLDIGPPLEGELEAGAQPMTPMPEDPGGPPPRLAVAAAPTPARGTAAPSDDDGAGAPDSAATESLCRRARDPADKGRLLALRALRRRPLSPAVKALLADLRRGLVEGDDDEALRAAEALGELRDTQAIPALIERLVPAPSPVASAAEAALVALAAQSFGPSQRRWSGWWHRSAARHRIEWLIDGLGHADAPIRAAAAEELRHLTGDSFGYDADLPKPDRARVQDRARAWWEAQNRSGTSDDTSGNP